MNTGLHKYNSNLKAIQQNRLARKLAVFFYTYKT